MDTPKGLSGQYQSLSIGTWGDIPTPAEATEFSIGEPVGNELVKHPFYINNLAEDAIVATGKGINMPVAQNVKLMPGWNEYIFTEIVVPIGATLQWGR